MTPVSVYLVWHHASKTAPKHAEHLFDWFRLRTGEALPRGARLPVHFRLRIDRHTSSLKPPIALERAERNYIVLLIDEHMVADRTWREVLKDLVTSSRDQRSSRNRFFPVALHRSARRLAPEIAELQTISPRNRTSTKLSQFEQEKLDLRRALTEAFARDLRADVCSRRRTMSSWERSTSGQRHRGPRARHSSAGRRGWRDLRVPR